MSKIYVAEPSRILSKVICSKLESLGYETQAFSDGLSILKQITAEPPALVIAAKSLPIISGIELCSIIKNGSIQQAVPFILVSSDDQIFDFWNSSTQIDKVISISGTNIDVLMDSVNELLSGQFIEASSFFDDEDNQAAELTDEEKVVSSIVNTMSRSETFLNMVNNVIKLYGYVKNTDVLVENLFKMLYSVCEYDVITLVFDSQPAMVYHAGTESFPRSVMLDFWDICKAEYEGFANKTHTVVYEEKTLPGLVLAGELAGGNDTSDSKTDLKADPKKLGAYRAFTVKTDDEFVGTLHIGSVRKRVFSYKVMSAIEYVLPAIAAILQESVQRSKLMQQDTRMRSAFSKFVPEQVIDDFLNSSANKKIDERNEKRNVVILMCDMRNFTSISEVNKPEDIVNLLNTYFDHMVSVVRKYGGTVDKFIGDAIMALFGAPVSYADNAKRAVMAAIEMCGQLDKIPCSHINFPEGMKLDMGIGIHYGEVIVGQIGSEDKMNYTVIGDTVNIAYRMESLTKLYGAKVVISQALCDELDGSVNLLVQDSIKLKGKTRSVLVYRADKEPLPKDFTEAYEKGFKLYREGAFSLAIPYFEKALETMPQDKAAKLMLGRCVEFAENKPENWDGAVALKFK